MQHKRSGRTLGRKAHVKEQMLRNLTNSLLEHGSIVTTSAKAKELRSYFEPLVSNAREDLTLARRRQLLEKVKRGNLDSLVKAAKTQSGRRGGYLRLVKLPSRRSDGAGMARVEIS